MGPPEGDDLFVDAPAGDYRVGFQNFPIIEFGVQWPKLKAIARTPELPRPDSAQPATLKSGRDTAKSTWLGATITIRNVIGMGEVSARPGCLAKPASSYWMCHHPAGRPLPACGREMWCSG
jgi:hypothetical protein